MFVACGTGKRKQKAGKGSNIFLCPSFLWDIVYTKLSLFSILCVDQLVHILSMRVGVVARQPFICYIQGYRNFNIHAHSSSWFN